jgi:signal transduction histidine kinase
VELRVGDNGIGFDSGTLGSNGLGLATIQTYASMSGGTCTVQSENTGTIITFRIPLSSA